MSEVITSMIRVLEAVSWQNNIVVLFDEPKSHLKSYLGTEYSGLEFGSSSFDTYLEEMLENGYLALSKDTNNYVLTQEGFEHLENLHYANAVWTKPSS